MTLAILFIIFASAAFIHLFVQNVVFPTLFLDLKIKLQNLIEDVNKLKKEYTNNLQKVVLERMEGQILTTLQILPQHNILHYTIFKFKYRNKKTKASTLAIKHYNDLKNSNIPNILRLEEKHYKLVKRAFLVCSGMFIFYFSPLILLMELIMTIMDKLKAQPGDNEHIDKLATCITERKITEYGKFEISQTRSSKKKKQELVYV